MIRSGNAQLEDYEPLKSLKTGNTVQLVTDRRSSGIFVMKIRDIYDLDVYEYLAANPRAGLPRIINCFERHDKLVVVEEYINGSTLAEILDEKGVLEPKEAVDVLLRLCAILIPLHRHSPPIVHRDIKPSNIIISYDAAVTLIDFNSAKLSYPSQSRDTELIGTSGYAAPEQYGFSVSKPSTDVFALGVVLNELLTGHSPATHITTGFLKPIIERCWKMEADNRYRDAGELQEALEALVLTKKPSLVLSKGWRSWLPPGYRRFKPWSWIIASIAYYMLLTIVWSYTSDDGNLIETILVRLWIFTLFMSQVLYWGDFRLLRSRLPGTRHKNILLRQGVTLAYCLALLLTCIIGLGLVLAILLS